MVKHITDSSFDADLAATNLPILVDFWADWCGPCKMVAPILDELSTELDGKAVIAKINIDENPMKAAQLGIRSIPTMMIFKGGKMVDQRVGAMRKNDLSAWLNQHIA